MRWQRSSARGPRHIPLFLIKPGTSVIGPGDPIRRPAAMRARSPSKVNWASSSAAAARTWPPSDAGDFIFGYTCVNDVTAADVLNENPDFAQWCRSKGYDTFGCLGPVIATDFNWSRARVTTQLDGVERQNYPLSDMIISPPSWSAEFPTT